MPRQRDSGVTGNMRLRFMKQGRMVRSVKVKAKTLTIGSGKRATVRVGGVPDLAPEHALVWLDEGAPTLVPSNGATVLLNGQATRYARLRPDDIVTLGQLGLQVEAIDDGEEVATAPPRRRAPVPPPVAPSSAFDDEPTKVALPRPHFELERVATRQDVPFRSFAEDDVEPTIPGALFPELAQELEEELAEDVAEPWPALPETEEFAVVREHVAPPLDATYGAAGESPAPPEPAESSFFDDEDDDEDDEFAFVEPFSLVEQIRQKVRSYTSGPREDYVVTQVFRHNEGRIWEVSSVEPGRSYLLGPGKPSLLEMGSEGRCSLSIRPGMGGIVGRGESEVPATEGKTELGEGDWASIETDECNYIVHVIRPPRPTPPSLLSSVIGTGILLVYAFVVTAAFGGGALAFASFSSEESETTENRHVTHVDLTKSLALLPPNSDIFDEEPVEPEESENSATPDENTEPVRGPPRRVRRPNRPTKNGQGTASSKLLAALTKGGHGGGSGQSIADIISSFDAPGNTVLDGFSLPGMPGVPGGKIRFAKANGAGGPVTTGINGIRGENPGIGVVQPPTGKRRTIRCKVTRAPAPPPGGEGELEASAVIAAINRRMGAITRCYERRLMSNPSLGGRINFGWTITPSGSVSGLRVRSSSLGDTQVASCVAGVLRGIRFPQPRGGSVQISYPFIFRAID